MVTPSSQQSRLRFFALCSSASHGAAESPTPIKGEDVFNICCRLLFPLLEMRWMSCNKTLAFIGAKLVTSRSGLAYLSL